MKMIKNIANGIAEENLFVETISANAKLAVQQVSAVRIGLTENYHSLSEKMISKGDIIIDPKDSSVYVASGEQHDGHPIGLHPKKRKKFNPASLTHSSDVEHPGLRKAAARVASEHPTRRVHVHNSPIGEAVTNLSDQPLSAKDKGIRTKEKMPKPGDTSKGAEVHNDEEIFDTFMKKAGKTEKHKLGDKDGGNANVEVTESLSDRTIDSLEDKLVEIKSKLKGMRDRKDIAELERQKLSVQKMIKHKKETK